MYTLDLCEACMFKVLHGEAIHGWGAQGHNTYEIKELDAITN